MKPVTTYLDDSTLNRLYKLHEKTDAPLSAMIRKAVKFFLKSQEV